MKNALLRPLYFAFSFLACTIMAFTSGCASGGYKLTREYSRWVNSKTLILRIILYLLTGIVYAITMLIDLVIFNTVDFWEGKVSAGSYEFKQGEKMYVAVHEVLPETSLKRSTISVTDAQGKLVQVVVLNETAGGEVEMLVDGQLRTRVKNISEIPLVAVYDNHGQQVSEKMLFFNTTVAVAEPADLTE